MNIKTAIIFFIIGVGQGFILTDWKHQRDLLKVKPIRKGRT